MSAAQKHFFDPASLAEDENTAEQTVAPVAAVPPLPTSVPTENPTEALLGATSETPAVSEPDLSAQFSDPVLFDQNGQFQNTEASGEQVNVEAIQPDMLQSDSASLLEDTAVAVKELVTSHLEHVDPAIIPGMDMTPIPPEQVGVSTYEVPSLGQSADASSHADAALAQMA